MLNPSYIVGVACKIIVTRLE